MLAGEPAQLEGILHYLDGVTCLPKDQVCDLCDLLDPALSMGEANLAISSSVFSNLQQITQLQPYVDRKSLMILVHVLVISRTDYCNALQIGLPLKVAQKLQQVHSVAARFILGLERDDRISPILAHLHWLPVCFCA